MKRFLTAALLALLALTVVVPQADARRLGGGGSYGRQSQSFRRAAPPQYAQPYNNNAAPAQNRAANGGTAAGAAAPRPSPWRGMLGGALLGLGLGALLAHFGIGGPLAGMIGAVLTIVLLVFVVLLVLRLIRGNGAVGGPSFGGYRQEPYDGRPAMPGTGVPSAPAYQAGGAGVGGAAPDVNFLPPGFDVPSFLRSAKTYFIRMQTAWDRADIDDIREFTTPEMYAELRLQLQERGAAPNHTDVVSLDAELYGVETIGDEYLASVKFSGMIREAENAPAEPFTEAWNLAKPVDGSGGWVLAGIQQLP